MTGRVSVFVDESGDTTLDLEGSKKGCSKMFVVAAVVIKPGDLDSARAQAEAVRKRFFQTGEMKSSKLKGGRRTQVLKEVAKLPFTSVVLAADKARLTRPGGLQYKKSFFKNLNNRLYRQVYLAFPEVDVVADEHGDKTFMVGFKRYLHRKQQLELFTQRTFDFRPSHEEPLIQVADLLAGSLRKQLEECTRAADGSDPLQLLRPKIATLLVWPPGPYPLGYLPNSVGWSLEDQLVYEHCVRLAHLFLQRAERDPEANLLKGVLEYLLFHVELAAPERFVPTGELRRLLRQHFGTQLSEQQFRAKVIAKLRDADVIVASGPKGYKIPATVSDLRQYVELADRVIRPMLARLETARSSLKLGTHGALDILDGPELRPLRELLDTNQQVQAELASQEASSATLESS
jgi:hypothetical protein